MWYFISVSSQRFKNLRVNAFWPDALFNFVLPNANCFDIRLPSQRNSRFISQHDVTFIGSCLSSKICKSQRCIRDTMQFFKYQFAIFPFLWLGAPMMSPS